MLNIRIQIGIKRIGIPVSLERTDARCFCLIGKERCSKMMPKDSYSSPSAFSAHISLVEHFLDVMPKVWKLNERTPVTDKDFLLHASWSLAGNIVP